MKILYRLEHKETKAGPFSHCINLDNPNSDSFYEARSYAGKMPSIDKKKVSINYLNGYNFAFLKLNQIKEWFGSHKETWDKLGFVVRIFSVDESHYHTDEYQAVFLREAAEIVEEVRIVEVCS